MAVNLNSRLRGETTASQGKNDGNGEDLFDRINRMDRMGSGISFGKYQAVFGLDIFQN